MIFRKLCSRGEDDDDEDEDDERESNLEVKFFSFTTFWYIVSAFQIDGSYIF